MDSNFKLGGDVDIAAIPKDFPHQLLYASSASSVDTAFFNKYRDFSKKMILGDPRYFVADINCDVVINTTFHGKPYASLLSRETVENEIRNNPEKAQREYYNKFSENSGANQIIKRNIIVRNSYNRPPVLQNDTNERKFVLAYDPARQRDNAVLAIGELIYDDEKGYSMDIVNCISFADLSLRKKTPMMTQQQIKEIKKVILSYNGNVDDYENIECFLIDAGSGGGGGSWVADSLIENWTDKKGKEHKGLIDKEYSEEYIKRYPEAKDKLKILEPSKYKSLMYESLIRMCESDLIHFTETYDNKGHLNLMQINHKLMDDTEQKIRKELDGMDLDIAQYEDLLEERLSCVEAASTKIYKLSIDEEVALTQIDVMKEQIVNICRTKRESGKDSFGLPAYKDATTGVSNNTMHDDHAYCLAMLGYYLAEKRVEATRNKKRPKKENIASKLSGTMRSAQRRTVF